MSWGVTYRSLADFENDTPSNVIGTPSPEIVGKAREAAAVLIKNKSVGDRLSYDFSVNLSGHENPSQAPAPGMSNDFVHISVTQLKEKT